MDAAPRIWLPQQLRRALRQFDTALLEYGFDIGTDLTYAQQKYFIPLLDEELTDDEIMHEVKVHRTPLK
jgi:hypothetical protein